MKKIHIIIILICFLGLTSCQRGCQSINREFQTSKRNYHVKLYSGGKLIRDDKFIGILNQEEHSDGLFYFKNDSLIEIGGQYNITSSDN